MITQNLGEPVECDLTLIDRKADAFEEAWRHGQRPMIEDHLGEVSGPLRATLIHELLMIEWQRRLGLGEQPLLEEYIDRFPEQAVWGRILTLGQNPSLRTTAGFDNGAGPSFDSQLPILSEYEVMAEIGRGGMGVVYLARKRSQLHDRNVALKMIADHLVSRDNVDRFVLECQKQARFSHPHIVQVLDSGQDAGRPYFTMTFYGGSDLACVLTEHGPFEPRTAALYVSRIAWAVHFLHDRAHLLLHRDLKPQNVLLDQYPDSSFPFGRPYLADFGLVQLIEEASPNSARGAVEGTIPYMAPEQVEGKTVVPASDVWGLGVMLFELLTGRRPFRGETNAETIYQIVHQETPSPRAIRPEIPLDLQRICLKCLKKPLETRYASAVELIEDLECFFKNEPLVHVRPEALRERVSQWAWRAPALAARLAVIVTCSAIIWSYPLITGHFAPVGPDHPVVTTILPHLGRPASSAMTAAVLVWTNQITLVAWGLVSWAFQRQLERGTRDNGIQFGWRIADVIALVVLIQLDDALMSPLTVAFAVLIVASSLGSHANQIIQTTLLSMAGYGLLAITYRFMHPLLDRPYRHFHYLAGLAVLCVILVYQANRTRALDRIGGERLRV